MGKEGICFKRTIGDIVVYRNYGFSVFDFRFIYMLHFEHTDTEQHIL